jgi:DNA (cytosine-5)-methyltransferase 1
LNGLDLFSGYGGISIGLDEWVNPIAFCEIDKYAQGILLSRMRGGLLPNRPIWDDIRTLKGDCLPNIDILYGGFPCQDISCAGNGKGLGGERSGLFYELSRLVKEVNPKFVFLENVPAVRTRGLQEIVRTFTDLRYDCRWTCVSAKEVGAPHLRKRWFLLAHASGLRIGPHIGPVQRKQNERDKIRRYGPVNSGSNVSYSDETRLQRKNKPKAKQSEFAGCCQWGVEPDVCRVVDGLANRVDRIRALGNGVVPTQVTKAFKKLMGVA